MNFTSTENVDRFNFNKIYRFINIDLFSMEILNEQSIRIVAIFFVCFFFVNFFISFITVLNYVSI